MKKWKELLLADLKRYKNGKISKLSWTYRFLKYYRKSSCCKKGLISKYYRFRFSLICQKHNMEFPRTIEIGKSLYIGHPFNITINGSTKIGDNVNIHKGVTIGQENRGKRKGTPIIGNQVWIGINSTIVGRVTIGDDVLIAPNCYVNCDIPSHSIALGNPCRIIPKENATEAYICNMAL